MGEAEAGMEGRAKTQRLRRGRMNASGKVCIRSGAGTAGKSGLGHAKRAFFNKKQHECDKWEESTMIECEKKTAGGRHGRACKHCVWALWAGANVRLCPFARCAREVLK